MRGLPPPDPQLWRRRIDWFWSAHDANAGPHPLDLDARQTALLGELEMLFGAGAWGAVVVIGWTLVEAVARRSDPIAGDLDWLRERRNELAHAGGSDAALDDQAMLQTAEGAVRTVFKTLFAEAWTRGASR